MADLLAKQSKTITLNRGMEVHGEVVAILPQEIILDLGAKSEGVLPKKSLPDEQLAKLKIGDKLTTFVLSTENESGQAVLGMQRSTLKNGPNLARFTKFETAMRNKQVLSGKGLEINKGGVIVEVQGTRGFLPISQLSLSQMANPDELIGKDIQVIVIEIDQAQNRLIFSQKVTVNEETLQKLSAIRQGDKIKGQIAGILPFGLFVKLENGLEGLVHISEVSWEKVEKLDSLFKVGDEVECSVLSIDTDSGKLNLSLKQLREDPFTEAVKKFQTDDVVKGTVKEIGPNALVITLSGEIEGNLPTSKLEGENPYAVGEIANFVVDSIDEKRRKVNLAPFITSTKDLIYK